ncbi:nuclease domain-containing protein [Longimicrobium sp.]|uniref:nuclease domain-containing protein n=1 Tax=Longimicrobium sp. TaxID=2029185 RepID=UPI002C90A10E|nr:nuclease domain-containing protein [Longimicrobium sp.]HSU17509.1 nuclease domain-containing protein [Longimicrobium sp.]
MRARLRRLGPVLRGPRHTALAAEAAELEQTLRAARHRASFLDQAGELAHTPDRLTMVLLKRDPYRAALAGLLELHRRVAVQLQAPEMEAPLENLPALYQLWGTLHVADALLDAAAGHGWRVSEQRLVQRTRDGLFVQALPGNQAAVTLLHEATGGEVKLIPERTYGAGGELRSFTYRQIPDVAVELRVPGASPRVWLFDPKYKLDGEPLDAEGGTKPLKVDIDKMHAYRDAIRTPEGNRVVRCAAILYPGPPVRYNGGIEAISAVPEHDASIRERLHAILSSALSNPESGVGSRAA